MLTIMTVISSLKAAHSPVRPVLVTTISAHHDDGTPSWPAVIQGQEPCRRFGLHLSVTHQHQSWPPCALNANPQEPIKQVQLLCCGVTKATRAGFFAAGPWQ